MHQYSPASGGTTPAEHQELETALNVYAEYYALSMERISEMMFNYIEFKAVLSHKDRVNGFKRPRDYTPGGICLSSYVAAYLDSLGILDRI
jgi:hypothetical protein